MQIREEEQCFCVGAVNALQHQLSPAVANCNRNGVTMYIQTDVSATVIHEGAPCRRELWFDSPSTYSTGAPFHNASGHPVIGKAKPSKPTPIEVNSLNPTPIWDDL